MSDVQTAVEFQLQLTQDVPNSHISQVRPTVSNLAKECNTLKHTYKHSTMSQPCYRWQLLQVTHVAVTEITAAKTSTFHHMTCLSIAGLVWL